MKIKILPALAVGVLLLGACRGSSGKYEAINNSSSADSASVDSRAADTSTAVQTKLVKTADMRFKVKDVRQTSENISTLTAKYNGMVMHHQMQATNEGSQDTRLGTDSIMHISLFTMVADMTVNIPPNNLENFMNQVAQLGLYIDSRKMNIDDKSLEYLSSKLKTQNREELVKQQDKAKEDPSRLLVAKDDIVDRKINDLKTDKDVKYSTVVLSFYQSKTVIKEVVANEDTAAYQPSFFKRLVSSFSYGWSFFADLILGVANLWAFILAAIGLWILVKYYKRKNPALFRTIKS
ncbi:protein of unknown function [Mucilaginibacter pineti]|uniref:DUF4349 domain-containing protein n=1 Tax=Mucilaginibacter pineti TaxID=1391627 RepID=A0A1G7CWT0_9SPHI|nr:DUF4349 domain-containing protein [Mucilaginibacter pineti]SDE42945.1 protein of unknown function [Mucilaginibacter pineti]